MDIPGQEQKIDLTKPFDPTKGGGVCRPGTDVKVEKGKEGKEKIKVNGKEYDSHLDQLQGERQGRWARTSTPT